MATGWLPLFANGGGDFYAADLAGDPIEPPIIGFILGEHEHPIEYYLEADDKRHAELARHHKPSLPIFVTGAAPPDIQHTQELSEKDRRTLAELFRKQSES
jgi:hypothetical protein